MKRWYAIALVSAVIGAALAMAVVWWHWPGWLLVAYGLLWFFVLAWASLTLRARVFVPAHCRGKLGTLALTFDDGPHPEITPSLLDLLARENVKASFFCIGRNVERHPALAKRIVDEGHAIGIHSQDHRWTWGFASTAQVVGQITTCSDAIQRATGARTNLFRPPFGVTNPQVARAVARTGVTTIGWDLRTFDTTFGPERVMSRWANRGHRGTIAVLHDTQPGTVDLVGRMIAFSRTNGTELVRCDAHLR